MSTTPRRLEGQVAVVTGANQGMGRVIAERFGAEGARLFLTDRNDANLPALAGRIAGLGSEAAHRVGDVTRPADVEAVMGEAERRFGQIDVLVNAAGIFQARRFLDYPLADWNEVLAVNLTGTMLACQAALRRMLPRKRGKLINLASAAGRAGGRFRAGYSTSKHAVVGLTRCLALEFAAEGITANAICPGMIDTDMFAAVIRQDAELLGERDLAGMHAALLKRSPQGRMIQPGEIAALAAYLASPEADSFTGQAVSLDGGMVMV
jgi:NAD(P)-dependent dehydrogenase (short-subunit alcohol dehydrogenase family)